MLRLIGLVNLVVFGLFTILTVILAVPIQLLVLPWDPDRHWSAWVARTVWGIGMIRGQPFWRLTITGLEATRPGPWVVVANHQSMVDILVLLTLPIPLRIVARPGVFRMPVFGHMARFGKHVCIDPDEPMRALEECKHWLDRGVSILMFPEGSRGDGTGVAPFQRGAFELALRAQAKVLPIAISGTADAMPKGSMFARRPISRFHVQVLSPLDMDGSRRRLAAAAHDRIAAALGAPA